MPRTEGPSCTAPLWSKESRAVVGARIGKKTSATWKAVSSRSNARYDQPGRLRAPHFHLVGELLGIHRRVDRPVADRSPITQNSLRQGVAGVGLGFRSG